MYTCVVRRADEWSGTRKGGEVKENAPGVEDDIVLDVYGNDGPI